MARKSKKVKRWKVVTPEKALPKVIYRPEKPVKLGIEGEPLIVKLRSEPINKIALRWEKHVIEVNSLDHRIKSHHSRRKAISKGES